MKNILLDFKDHDIMNQMNNKNMDTTMTWTHTPDKQKKSYIPPSISVITIEMEQGIAAGSATATPGVINGNTDAVTTDWGGTDTTTIETPF